METELNNKSIKTFLRSENEAIADKLLTDLRSYTRSQDNISVTSADITGKGTNIDIRV